MNKEQIIEIIKIAYDEGYAMGFTDKNNNINYNPIVSDAFINKILKRNEVDLL
jgi:hypothetical protein